MAGSSEAARFVGRLPRQPNRPHPEPAPGPVEAARPERESAHDRPETEQLPARKWGVHTKQAGDEALFGAVYEEHGRAVFAFTARVLEERTGVRDAAADITQETFERAWRNPDILTEDHPRIRAWLLTVARNLIVDRGRRVQARPQEVSDLPIAYGGAGATPDHAERVATAVSVHDALAGLSNAHLEVLQHVYFQQHSVAEAADAIGIAPGTVKSRTHHALAALRGAFGVRGERP